VPPSFNEFDMSDKPLYIQKDAELQPAHFPTGALRKLDMTLAVAEMIQAVFDTLESTDQLENTYVFFVSDNGLLWESIGSAARRRPMKNRPAFRWRCAVRPFRPVSR